MGEEKHTDVELNAIMAFFPKWMIRMNERIVCDRRFERADVFLIRQSQVPGMHKGIQRSST